jgi:hypothetical protein
MSNAYIGDALREIYDRHGALNAEIVVQTARAEDHPLHHRFEWDDTVAGAKYRLVQGQQLIRSVKIVRVEQEDEGPSRVRAFIHIPQPTEGAEDDELLASYVPIDVVSSSVEMTAIAKREMQRRLNDLRRTYGEYEEFWAEIRNLAA